MQDDAQRPEQEHVEPVAPAEVLPAPSRRGRRGSWADGDGKDRQGFGMSDASGEGEDAAGSDVRRPGSADGESRGESVDQPGKVMRIGAMLKQLLEEVRQAPLDEAGRSRLREIYELSVRELATGLSPDLASELDRMALPFGKAVPSEAELRIAQAQLVGWLEGLFHGIQATLMAQQMAARAQLEEMRHRGLPSGSDGEIVTARPGTYL